MGKDVERYRSRSARMRALDMSRIERFGDKGNSSDGIRQALVNGPK